MKIAFVEYYPRICGTGDGTVHLSAAAQELGHTMERITFSKSGRQLKAFGAKGDDWDTIKLADGPAYLDEFDFIIPSDVVCQHPSIDGEAIKTSTMPYYVDLLRRTSTPFALLIWGGYYHGKHDPFIEALIDLPNFTRTVWSPRVPDAGERMARFEGADGISWVDVPYHPYDVNTTSRYVGDRGHEILMTSRVTSPKGQDVALEIFSDLGHHVNVWGTSAYGRPSQAWRLWELGCAMGYKEVQFPQLASRSNNQHPLAHKFYTGRFTFENSGGHHYRFHDAYNHVSEIDWAPWLGISLTNNLLHGSLEYACLDVIGNGSVLLPPAHMTSFCQYDSIEGMPFNHAAFSEKEGKVKAGRNDWDRNGCLEMIQGLLSRSHAELQHLANRQYHELQVKHDPTLILRPLIQEAGR